MDSLVSIVVPVYNVAPYLDQCFTCLVNQTYPHLEIIVVDDGATDDSPAICEAWAKKDPRIRVIHKQNAGLGMARNTGLEYVTGKYVLFLDSDDYMDTTTVEKCVRQSEEYNADMVMFGRTIARADGTFKKLPIANDPLVFTGQEVVSDILHGLFTHQRGVGISAWGKLYTTKTLQDNNILFCSERVVLAEDAFFNLEAFAYISRVAILPENLYYYRENNASLSRTYKKNHQNMNDVFWKESLELCRRVGHPQKVIDAVCARYHMLALSGMKRIMRSSLTRKEKQEELQQVFHNDTLHSTMIPSVLQKETTLSRLFWKLFKWRLYPICTLLLWVKAK